MEGLKRFIKDFIHLRSEMQTIEQVQAQRLKQKSDILQRWNSFQTSHLKTISSFLS